MAVYKYIMERLFIGAHWYDKRWTNCTDWEESRLEPSTYRTKQVWCQSRPTSSNYSCYSWFCIVLLMYTLKLNLIFILFNNKTDCFICFRTVSGRANCFLLYKVTCSRYLYIGPITVFRSLRKVERSKKTNGTLK